MEEAEKLGIIDVSPKKHEGTSAQVFPINEKAFEETEYPPAENDLKASESALKPEVMMSIISAQK